jgi:CRISPR-associated protein Csm2
VKKVSENIQHRDFKKQPASSPDFNKIKLAKPAPELFNEIAEEMAMAVAFREDGKLRSENKSTQLRRFYDELVLWEMRINQQEVEKQAEKFEESLPFIRMINAKAAYAKGRKLVDQTFVDLMHHTLNEVKDAKTMTACKLFWEAFTGFYKQVRPKD